MKAPMIFAFGMVFFFFSFIPTGTALQEHDVGFDPQQGIAHDIADVVVKQTIPALLPNGEYVGHTREILIVFRKNGIFVTGALYFSGTQDTYCLWGAIAPNGDIFAQEIIINKIHAVDENTVKDLDDEDEVEVSVALENFEVTSWRKFNRLYEASHKEAMQDIWAIFADCDHFFATLERGH